MAGDTRTPGGLQGLLLIAGGIIGEECTLAPGHASNSPAPTLAAAVVLQDVTQRAPFLSQARRATGKGILPA